MHDPAWYSRQCLTQHSLTLHGSFCCMYRETVVVLSWEPRVASSPVMPEMMMMAAGGGGRGGAGSECGGTEEPGICSGCGDKITDRYYLLAVEKQWHVTCLVCVICKLPLDSEVTCFAKDGDIYCKDDYYRSSQFLYLCRCRYYYYNFSLWLLFIII